MALRLAEEDRGSILQDLRRVGPEKNIGYLPLYTICDILGLTVEELEAEAEQRGLATARFGSDHCCIKSGALYVYDRHALEVLLKASSTTLYTNDWPLNPNAFVRLIAAEWFEPSNPIVPIIYKAFGDEFFQSIRDENTKSVKSG